MQAELLVPLGRVRGLGPRALRDAADEPLRAFAATLGDGDLVFDLREQVVGSGFAWGRRGPNAPVKRHGDSLLFAVVAPAKKPGVLGRFFGRST